MLMSNMSYMSNMTLPCTAVEVNPTITTSAAEKHVNVKKVHYQCFNTAVLLHIFVETVLDFIYQHSVMSRKFKRTAFNKYKYFVIL